MHPIEFAKYAQPRPRDIWLSMEDNQTTTQLIIVSDHFRARERSPLGTIARLGSETGHSLERLGIPLVPGDTVLLATMPSIQLIFGERNEVVYHVVEPMAIQGVFRSGETPSVVDRGQYVLGRYPLGVPIEKIAEAARSTQGVWLHKPEE